jgi:hypothetical protein
LKMSAPQTLAQRSATASSSSVFDTSSAHFNSPTTPAQAGTQLLDLKDLGSSALSRCVIQFTQRRI